MTGIAIAKVDSIMGADNSINKSLQAGAWSIRLPDKVLQMASSINLRSQQARNSLSNAQADPKKFIFRHVVSEPVIDH